MLVDALDDEDVGWMKGSDEPLCLDVDVRVVEQVDESKQVDSDESFCSNDDVNPKDCCCIDVADLIDAASMQQM